MLQYIDKDVVAQILYKVTPEEFKKFEQYNQQNPFNKVEIMTFPDVSNPLRPVTHYNVVISTKLSGLLDVFSIRKKCEQSMIKFMKTYKNDYFKNIKTS